jgi:hypothetical protein
LAWRLLKDPLSCHDAPDESETTMQSIIQSDVFCDAPRGAQLAPSMALAPIWSRTSRLKEVWAIVQEIGTWQGVAFAPLQNGLEVILDHVKLGRLSWSGRLDLPFAAHVADRLVAEGFGDRVSTWPESERLVLQIRTADDVDRALCLLRLAYLVL